MQLELHQKQTTNLVMTAELRQAINLLQYNTNDLLQFLYDQAKENPLIELDEADLDIEMESDYFPTTPVKSISHHSDFVNAIEFTPQSENHLLDSILHQVGCLKITKEKRNILEYIVLNLDDNGFLTLTAAEIAEQNHTSTEKVESCLYLMRHLEPLGIGSKDIKECLHIQALHYYPENTNLHWLIENHLYDLADKRWGIIAESLDISLTEVNELFERVANLNPKPSNNLFHPETEYLFPDVSINETYGEYTVTLSDVYLPAISFNQDYLDLKKTNPQLSSYIQSNYRNYLWLKNSMEQRRDTILNIVRMIIEKQPQFLKYGKSYLQPMTKKEIADAVELHETTVGRAIRNKVIRTPAGSIDMHELFSSKLRRHDSGYVSSVQVKILLKRTVQKENPKKPFSDQNLADMLNRENGIAISRRTVAKYREELQILSSAKRKTVV